ncbi:MAG: MerR family transcriptional regulator [Gemmatimonadetes bacterium]|nr:MAG: MerR family transcriptional regulator [Gemmatimonadota bacterium]
MKYLTIGKVAKQAQVNIQTIRYYERQELLPKPLRSESGYRQYTSDTVKRIRFIKHAQELGFSLKEIAELLALRVHADVACESVKSLAEAKIQDIELKIQSLQRMKQTLSTLVTCCEHRKNTSDCPILEALEPPS